MHSLETRLALALKRIEELEVDRETDNKEIRDLKAWKESCTRWGAWWAGVCACAMTFAALVRTYWDVIISFVQRQ